jgi:hypothetical protein
MSIVCNDGEDGFMIVMITSCGKPNYLRYEHDKPLSENFTDKHWHYIGWEFDAYKKSTRWKTLKDAMGILNEYVQAGGYPWSGGYFSVQYSYDIRKYVERIEDERKKYNV